LEIKKSPLLIKVLYSQVNFYIKVSHYIQKESTNDSGMGIIHSSDFIVSTVSQIIDYYGTSSNNIIPILLGIQNKLNWLPPEALVEVCRITEITPGQITEISTFYPQFRHTPQGRHIIQFCSGSTCGSMGAKSLKQAFLDFLKIGDGKNCSPDNEFSVEDVECLGVCSISPAVMIDGKLFGHLDPLKVEQVITDFRESLLPQAKIDNKPLHEEIVAEIRVGIGTCCVASGSKEVLTKLVGLKETNDLQIRIKPVGCTGACGFTPIMDVAWTNGPVTRYTNVSPDQVNSIISSIFPHVENREQPKIGVVNREEELNSFMDKQSLLATLFGGEISPVSLNEYLSKGGLEIFKRFLGEANPVYVIDLAIRNGFREKNGDKIGNRWKVIAEIQSDNKSIICHSEENDTGSFKDRLLLESFPFKIIEGMMIAGYATGISRGLFHISDSYPLAARRINNAISQLYKAGFLGQNIQNSGFSFEISVIGGPGDFILGDSTDEFGDMPVLMMNTDTLSSIPTEFLQAKQFNSKGLPYEWKQTIIIGLTGKIVNPGLIEVPLGTTISDVIYGFGGGILSGKKLKALHIGGLAGGFIGPDMLQMPLDYNGFEELGFSIGPGSILVLDETDSIVEMTKHFMDFARRQSCGKCTVCRVGTARMYDIMEDIASKKGKVADILELENLSVYLKQGSLCGLGKNAPNALLTALKYFRQEFEDQIVGK